MQDTRAMSARSAGVAAFLSLAVGCGPSMPEGLEPGEELSGGETTVFDTTASAFSYPATNLSAERRRTFFVGNSFFSENWVTAPSSTTGRDGLGPVFNAKACSSCHMRDGRGAPPATPDEALIGLLVRLSVPGMGENGGVVPEPTYGDQFNPYSILDVPAEGDLAIDYEEVPGTYADGTPYSLRKPTYTFENLAFGPMDPQVLTSPRTAPGVYGLGLLSALSDETLLELADPDDADGDGISGRPNYVWSVRRQEDVIGRFGWKANQPDLEHQNAGAFLGDMGITSPLFPQQNCTPSQVDCQQAIHGGDPEIDQDLIDDVTYYTHLLAVPGRRDWDDTQVLKGKALFRDAGCVSCHVPKLVTGELAGYPELSSQVIRPYSDLLLHDMGDGLADGRPDFDADGREWRTPPLWGIGLIETVNDHTFFLHDGRARDLTEAILWHGGEAERSREAFRTMSLEQREAMIAFLESL